MSTAHLPRLGTGQSFHTAIENPPRTRSGRFKRNPKGGGHSRKLHSKGGKSRATGSKGRLYRVKANPGTELALVGPGKKHRKTPIRKGRSFYAHHVRVQAVKNPLPTAFLTDVAYTAGGAAVAIGLGQVIAQAVAKMDWAKKTDANKTVIAGIPWLAGALLGGFAAYKIQNATAKKLGQKLCEASIVLGTNALIGARIEDATKGKDGTVIETKLPKPPGTGGQWFDHGAQGLLGPDDARGNFFARDASSGAWANVGQNMPVASARGRMSRI